MLQEIHQFINLVTYYALLQGLVNSSFVISGSIGALIPQGLPNITGQIHDNEDGVDESGALYQTGSASYSGHNQNSGRKYLNFDASRSNSIYGTSENVTPNSICCAFFIKY